MTIETELPAVKVSIPVAEEITADWGERCPDFEPGCFCCQMWAMHDEISRLQRENEHFTKSGIIEVAVRNISVSDYMTHWEGRALAAESRCEELVKALERSMVAINDWLHVYAPDECRESDVAESRARLWENGTLSYIAEVQEQNRAALSQHRKGSAALKELGKGDGR